MRISWIISCYPCRIVLQACRSTGKSGSIVSSMPSLSWSGSAPLYIMVNLIYTSLMILKAFKCPKYFVSKACLWPCRLLAFLTILQITFLWICCKSDAGSILDTHKRADADAAKIRSQEKLWWLAADIVENHPILVLACLWLWALLVEFVAICFVLSWSTSCLPDRQAFIACIDAHDVFVICFIHACL